MKETTSITEAVCGTLPQMCEWAPTVLDYAPLIGVGATGAAAGVGAILAYRRFLRREYHGQIVISLNTIEEEESKDYLRLYTLQEEKVSVALPDNRWLLKQVYKSASKTTEDDVFLSLSEAARYVVMPAVINGVSELNAEGKMARENGLPTMKRVYLAGITWEPYGDAIAHKFRIMLISEATLMRYFALQMLQLREERLHVKNPHHVDRIRTLQQMAAIRIQEEKNDVPINDRRIREVDWHQPMLTTDCWNCGSEVRFAAAA